MMPTDNLPLVYLSGPITGVSAPLASGWRTSVASELSGIANVIDPTRDNPDYVARFESRATRAVTAERLLHGKETLARCWFDIQRCDLVLAHYLKAQSPSVGSIGELFLAYSIGKPVIVVREDTNPHNHDMLNEIATHIALTLSEAIEKVKAIVAVAAVD